jgi:hypothetical protein
VNALDHLDQIKPALGACQPILLYTHSGLRLSTSHVPDIADGMERRQAPHVFGDHVEGAWICSPMTPAEEYRQRAIEFFDLAAKSDDPEEREALRTFALCCLQLERAEEDRAAKGKPI